MRIYNQSWGYGDKEARVQITQIGIWGVPHLLPHGSIMAHWVKDCQTTNFTNRPKEPT